jgi:hypothetical protein
MATVQREDESASGGLISNDKKSQSPTNDSAASTPSHTAVPNKRGSSQSDVDLAATIDVDILSYLLRFIVFTLN